MRFPLYLFLSACAAISIPFSAAAEEKTVWDLRQEIIPGKWEVSTNLQVDKHSEGLQIMAHDNGAMTQMEMPTHAIDAVQVTFLSNTPVEAMLIWHAKGAPAGSFLQVPFNINGIGSAETIGIDLTVYPQWTGRTDRMGVLFPQGSQVVFQSMTLQSWSGIGKLSEAWKSFWTFDKMLAYSINFLWGPLVTFNEIGRTSMFDTLPPRGVSVNRYFYYILAITAVGLCLHRLFGANRSDGSSSRFRKRAPHFFLFCCVFAGMWLFYDVRMGLEFLSYMHTDYVTHISKEPGTRTFRNYQNFYDVAEKALPILKKEPYYKTIFPEATQFTSILRYMTYPSLPIEASETVATPKLTLVFRRTDISVNEQGQLVSGNTVISNPGKILEQYDSTSFLFLAQ